MRYLPHTSEDETAMLTAIGLKNMEELFPTIPQEYRMRESLSLPEPLTEWELNSLMSSLANSMGSKDGEMIFVGAGSYSHFIPETVNYLLKRSEFSTAYTPYQPEISQGTLQGIFEYQTLTARLLGTDLANASMYDGASALAEALLMSIRVTKRKKIAISSLINPLYRRVVETYFKPTPHEIVEIPYLKNGRTDIDAIANLEEFAAIAVQSPNFMGVIEDLEKVGQKTKDEKTLFICCFSEALSYGLLKPPGALGADIVCGEGQSFGIPQSFGGPGLGMLGCKKELMRNMPGRLVGQTNDNKGERSFVLTLTTREQHIRRERATSNICSNQGLCALTCAMYLSLVGGTGLQKLARLNYDKTEYLKQALRGIGLKIYFDAPTFNEFVVEFPYPFEKTYQKLIRENIVAGIPLDSCYNELSGCYLLCVTETASRKNLDRLVKEIKDGKSN